MEMLLSRWRANILLAVVSLLLLTPVIQAIGVVEYPLPTPGNNALELVLGPDGNFWFADAAGNEIGHITPQGVCLSSASLSARTGICGLQKLPRRESRAFLPPGLYASLCCLIQIVLLGYCKAGLMGISGSCLMGL
jgi:hypothetical protein